METSLLARHTEAIRKQQSLVGESAVINGVTYPCIIGIENVHLPLEMGGFKQVAHANISIALLDITKSPVAPAIGNVVLLMPRNRTYRVDSISPTQTTWELQLQAITD